MDALILRPVILSERLIRECESACGVEGPVSVRSTRKASGNSRRGRWFFARFFIDAKSPLDEIAERTPCNGSHGARLHGSFDCAIRRLRQPNYCAQDDIRRMDVLEELDQADECVRLYVAADRLGVFVCHSVACSYAFARWRSSGFHGAPPVAGRSASRLW